MTRNDLESKRNKKEIAKKILLGIGAASLVAGILVFPGIGPMLAFVEKEVSEYQRESRVEFRRMQRAGLVLVTKYKKGVRILLTPKGKKRLWRYRLQELKLIKPNRWDQKWRLLMFDVPEARHGVRDLIRRKLYSMGFVNVQKSVFIHPYPCDTLVEVLRANYDLRPGELYVFESVVKEGEDSLREYFKV